MGQYSRATMCWKTWRRASFCFRIRYSAFFFDLSDKNFSKFILHIDRLKIWNRYFLDFFSTFAPSYGWNFKNPYLKKQVNETNKSRQRYSKHQSSCSAHFRLWWFLFLCNTLQTVAGLPTEIWAINAEYLLAMTKFKSLTSPERSRLDIRVFLCKQLHLLQSCTWLSEGY